MDHQDIQKSKKSEKGGINELFGRFPRYSLVEETGSGG